MNTRLIWLVSVLIVAPAMLRAEDPVWKQYTFKSGKFSVLFPAEPSQKDVDVPTSIGKVKATKYTAKAGAMLFSVSYNDFPPDFVKKSSPESLLDLAKTSFPRSKVRLTDEKELTFGIKKYPGREFLARIPDQPVVIRMRTWLVGNRLYVMMAAVPEKEVKSQPVHRFLDSFRLSE